LVIGVGGRRVIRRRRALSVEVVRAVIGLLLLHVRGLGVVRIDDLAWLERRHDSGRGGVVTFDETRRSGTGASVGHARLIPLKRSGRRRVGTSQAAAAAVR
jgi:hypothetical protein